MPRIKPKKTGFTPHLVCRGRPPSPHRLVTPCPKWGEFRIVCFLVAATLVQHISAPTHHFFGWIHYFLVLTDDGSFSVSSAHRQGTIRRHMNLSNPDFNVAQFQRQDSLTGMGLGLGRLKPELYKQRSLEGDEGGRRGGGCGRLHFILKFDCDLEQLIVKIHKAEDLPAKDFSGTSDPYVKIYLLPDRMTKHQTKVHRKTLNPVFDEVFLFPVAYSELPTRKLHFSVYDFDRFSRHDIIGQVVVDNFLDLADFPRETKLCREIQYMSTVRQPLFWKDVHTSPCVTSHTEPLLVALLTSLCVRACPSVINISVTH